MLELVKTLVLPRIASNSELFYLAQDDATLQITCPYYEAFVELEEALNLLVAGVHSCSPEVELIQVTYGEREHSIPVQEVLGTQECQEAIECYTCRSIKRS